MNSKLGRGGTRRHGRGTRQMEAIQGATLLHQRELFSTSGHQQFNRGKWGTRNSIDGPSTTDSGRGRSDHYQRYFASKTFDCRRPSEFTGSSRWAE
jgi:hypothetical protein